ncbi:OB-fold nucleic acid binding domain-containing protein [Amycolatopsis samaneae]|uniref:Error-prone DNA polymerase n=1 Tax=Amycolatopsis samaneae TaxID=664691 RepID=A0ABW5GXX7_9PSEU
MSAFELAAADLWATGITPDQHPVAFLREHLTARGAIPAAALLDVGNGTQVLVGGAVTHRQRSATAGGITFLNLEDETGMTNVVVSEGLWRRERTTLLNATALLIRGTAQVGQGTVSLVANKVTALDLATLADRLRDFR